MNARHVTSAVFVLHCKERMALGSRAREIIVSCFVSKESFNALDIVHTLWLEMPAHEQIKLARKFVLFLNSRD